MEENSALLKANFDSEEAQINQDAVENEINEKSTRKNRIEIINLRNKQGSTAEKTNGKAK
jgi:hypothetical protein